MRTCEIADCGGGHHAKGMCRMHYMRQWHHGDPLYVRDTICSIEGCEATIRGHKLCNRHLLRKQRFGDPLYTRPKPQPYVTNTGYRMLHMPGHPNAYANGRVLEHIVVMAETLGRPLAKGESIHHRNGNRLDNRPQNLELWSSRHPAGQRVSDLLTYAHEIIALYG
jgi:hypothetical protein